MSKCQQNAINDHTQCVHILDDEVCSYPNDVSQVHVEDEENAKHAEIYPENVVHRLREQRQKQMRRIDFCQFKSAEHCTRGNDLERVLQLTHGGV